MFTAEEGAWGIILKDIDNYENHFCKIFPIYEFITLTCGGGYDFSVFGARKLEVFIEERMKMNQPVAIPVGYEDRIY